ncbi:MAG: hypothetical protein MPW14_03395 [Candidatus Manganitrophus sp.]|nr:MAG: hypothetical protein MPW14_03395 [Candidatus Manganitrophus sp.]
MTWVAEPLERIGFGGRVRRVCTSAGNTSGDGAMQSGCSPGRWT